MKKAKSLLWLMAMLLPLMPLLSSCDKEDNERLSPTQGEISFQFILTKTYDFSIRRPYTLNDLSEIGSVVVTIEKDGVRQTLPSLPVKGNEEVVSTPYVALEAGDYKLISYRAFDKNATLIDVLDITLERDNDFKILLREQTVYELPTKVKQVLSGDNYFNTLYALCLEILGEDKTKWPQSWDFDGGVIDDTWAGLEFEIDDYGDPVSINGLIIDGDPQYHFTDGEEPVNMALTEFKHMKKLPAAIANLSSLVNLTIRNCDLEELPAEMAQMNLVTLHIENTNLAHFPDEMANMKHLINVYLLNNKFTQFPEVLTHIKDIYHFNMVNEQIDFIPESIRNWTQLSNLIITGSHITSIPDVFNDVYRMSILDFSNNKNLSTLPPSLSTPQVPYEGGGYTRKSIRALYLDGCAFTEIPKEIQRADICELSMSDNLITHITKEEIERMPDLNTLILDRNPLDGFPRVESENLGFLSLIDCGLTKEDVDVSGLPNLSPHYLFFTQEDYDRTFGDMWEE